VKEGNKFIENHQQSKKTKMMGMRKRREIEVPKNSLTAKLGYTIIL
jgi:copper(I)-binding protein